MKHFVENLRQVFSKDRLAMIAVVILLLGLLSWTWCTRYPLIALKEQEILQIKGLETEVTRLESQWSARQDERRKIDADLALACNRLFQGEPTSTSWSSQIENAPDTLTFLVRSDLPVDHPTYPETLSVLPTVWQVKGPTKEGDSLSHLMGFLHDLTTKQAKWIEVVEILINGNELTSTRAEFSLRLWFKKASVS